MTGSNFTAASAAARGTLLSILLRLASFLLSQLTVRFVTVSALGKASIPLELLLGTTLFLGREGFRLGLTKEIGESSNLHEESFDFKAGGVTDKTCDHSSQKQDSHCHFNSDELENRQLIEKRHQRIINVSWLSVPVGAAASTVALSLHLYSCHYYNTGSNYFDKFDYKLAGVLYCVASFIESLAEPLVLRCLQDMDFTTKAKAEATALVCKAAACFGMTYFTSRTWFLRIASSIVMRSVSEGGVGDGFVETVTLAVTSFGVSQVVYACTFTIIMYRQSRSFKKGILWPRKIRNVLIENPYKPGELSPPIQYFDPITLHLVLIFTLQGLFKHALTEADKIVLSTLSGSYDQGVYALAASYGGLAARLLLQPMEENARLLFSRQGALVAQKRSFLRVEGENKSTNSLKESRIHKDINSSLQDMENTYCFLLRVVLHLGLLFATIATNYTSILLRVLAGNRWGSNDETTAALSAFCVYTAFIALNGIAEAFIYGVARSGKDVARLGFTHAFIGGIFAFISPELIRTKGAVGLVIANCICMGLRFIYSLNYAIVYFAILEKETLQRIGQFLSRIIPHPVVLGMFCISFRITKVSRSVIYDGPISDGKHWILPAMKHVFVGSICVATTFAFLLYLESDIRIALIKLLKQKINVSEDSSINYSSDLTPGQLQTINKCFKNQKENKLSNKPTFSYLLLFKKWYMNQMVTHEIRTKCISAGVLGLLGDVCAQRLEFYLAEVSGRDNLVSFDTTPSFERLDRQRMLAMFCDGLFTGPLLHWIYEFYDRIIPVPDGDDLNKTETQSDKKMTSMKRFYATLLHVFIDNSIMTFVYVFLTMVTTAIFEGHYKTIPHELKYHFFAAVKASWISSMGLAPLQLVTFHFLSKEWKVLAVNIQDIIWVAMISFATHQNRK